MAICTKCGTRIGLFKKKYYSNTNVYCQKCYDKKIQKENEMHRKRKEKEKQQNDTLSKIPFAKKIWIRPIGTPDTFQISICGKEIVFSDFFPNEIESVNKDNHHISYIKNCKKILKKGSKFTIDVDINVKDTGIFKDTSHFDNLLFENSHKTSFEDSFKVYKTEPVGEVQVNENTEFIFINTDPEEEKRKINEQKNSTELLKKEKPLAYAKQLFLEEKFADSLRVCYQLLKNPHEYVRYVTDETGHKYILDSRPLRKIKEGEELCRKERKDHEFRLDILLLIHDNLISLKENDEAKKILKEIIELILNTDISQWNSYDQDNIYEFFAKKLMKEGHYNEALKLINKSLKSQFGRDKDYLIKGEIFERQGKHDKSIETYLEGIKNAGDKSELQQRLNKIRK